MVLLSFPVLCIHLSSDLDTRTSVREETCKCMSVHAQGETFLCLLESTRDQYNIISHCFDGSVSQSVSLLSPSLCLSFQSSQSTLATHTQQRYFLSFFLFLLLASPPPRLSLFPPFTPLYSFFFSTVLPLFTPGENPAHSFLAFLSSLSCFTNNSPSTTRLLPPSLLLSTNNLPTGKQEQIPNRPGNKIPPPRRWPSLPQALPRQSIGPTIPTTRSTLEPQSSRTTTSSLPSWQRSKPIATMARQNLLLLQQRLLHRIRLRDSGTGSEPRLRRGIRLGLMTDRTARWTGDLRTIRLSKL